MTCASCQFQWCWLCEKEYIYGHYDSGKCNGLQFVIADNLEEAIKNMKEKELQEFPINYQDFLEEDLFFCDRLFEKFTKENCIGIYDYLFDFWISKAFFLLFFGTFIIFHNIMLDFFYDEIKRRKLSNYHKNRGST